jgi:hypothetical protein
MNNVDVLSLMRMIDVKWKPINEDGSILSLIMINELSLIHDEYGFDI